MGCPPIIAHPNCQPYGTAADRALLPNRRRLGDGRTRPHGFATAHSSSLRFARAELAEGRLYAVVTPHAEQASFDAEVVDTKGNIYVSLSGYRTVALPDGITSTSQDAPGSHVSRTCFGGVSAL